VTTTFVYDPVDGALNSSLVSGPAPHSENTTIRFNGTATAAYDANPEAPTVATVQFSVDDGQWQEACADDGRYDSPIEDFSITLTDLPDGSHRLIVRTINSEGMIETNITESQFQVATNYYVFIPIVRR
jgi:hypothetical protein